MVVGGVSDVAVVVGDWWGGVHDSDLLGVAVGLCGLC